MWITTDHSILRSLVTIPSMLVFHSFGYWFAHSMMRKKCLWWIHKFHHLFAKEVTPVVAMAVTPAEYGFAYMLPFVFGSIMLRPSTYELVISAGIVSCCNLMIHSPSLLFLTPYYPKWCN